MEEQREYPFEFSVVMAVYNVEPFLREAVDSLVQQDFGFERIQLIMVDDGSTDGSGAICDEYAAQYPENVMVIHKENGGVSSARNEGLKHIQGRYINFMDSDDMLDENVMSTVYEFFEEHKGETDIVAIPLMFFDGAEGEHILNGKFKDGTRIISLIQEWRTIQMSCSASFIKAEAAEKMCFDTSMAYGEDAKEMQKLLLEKMTLGVVGNCAYKYRKRSAGESSALQNSTNNILWYMPSLKGLIGEIISHCIEKKGYIPKYVQNALMYDIQWRVLQKEIPDAVLSKEEQRKYKECLFSFLKYFDDDVIMAQTNIQLEHKAFLLKKKYERDADIQWNQNDAVLHYENTYICHLNTNKTHLDFISFTSNSICMEGYTVLIAENFENVKIWIEVNGEKILCSPISRTENRMALGEPIYFSYGFKGEVPINAQTELYTITFFCEVNGRRINRNNLIFGKFCPISKQYANAYYYRDGYVLTTDGRTLWLKKCGRRKCIKRELLYLKELWSKNDLGARKAVLARLLTAFLKRFHRKKIWLISDRIDKADDNGEAFFRYMEAHPQRNIKTYFAISPKSADYHRLKKIGKVIPFLGWRYKLLCLLSDKVISSQSEEYVFHPFMKHSDAYQDLIQTSKFVFLQHGIIHNDLSDWLNRFNKNISLFITSTYQEYNNILASGYYYSKDVIKLTGLSRYDRLYHQESKIVTIMPTWRAQLVTGIDMETGKRRLKSDFEKSQYYAMYNGLLNCQRLFDVAQKLGYTITFLNHPNMSSAMDKIKSDQRLKRLEGKAYRDVFAQSDLLITDYSSVAFDFAYLRKPIIYFQQDKEEFYSGAHTVKKGYFEHERDGFGEVEYSVEALVDRIIEYMENGCELKDKYRKRIDATFPFSDQNNCQRVYEEIIGVGDKT